ncbi:MAG: hypothetical protein WCC90_14465, partial [Methylocella sp.]
GEGFFEWIMGCTRVSARKQTGRGKAGLAVGRAIGAVVLLRKKPPAEPGGSGVARRFKIPNIGDGSQIGQAARGALMPRQTPRDWVPL